MVVRSLSTKPDLWSLELAELELEADDASHLVNSVNLGKPKFICLNVQSGPWQQGSFFCYTSPMRIILASQSPARRELMKGLASKMKIEFEPCVSDYPEDMRLYRQAWRLAQCLALGKARHVAGKFPNSVIIGADTFITCGYDKSGQRKIGKPSSIEDAKKIIRSMSGRVIGVYSGVAVVRTDVRGETVHEEVSYALTRLTIKKMTPGEVDLLAHQKNALQISGAFSIEGEGGKMITKIDGDYDNVIGLPIYLLEKMLKRASRR